MPSTDRDVPIVRFVRNFQVQDTVQNVATTTTAMDVDVGMKVWSQETNGAHCAMTAIMFEPFSNARP
ncbi:hypothetical protein DPMN_134061 [Dreissena polymorpha]|uniref:Uncharacterized protein n=1 Tax=Dreissena polymorpha TaxID=45954 RepID=A0A9D4FYA4_DREPO|nr:hypothetical protein DPMN_134061 [Dreissena polymorpha]